MVCEADDLDGRGMVVDFHDLDAARRFIDATIDHRHLNDVIEGEPTAERLAWWLYEALKGELPGGVGERLVAVRVHETPRTWAEYAPS